MTAKRAKSSSPRRAPVAARSASIDLDADFEPWWIVALGLAWLVVFCLFFYSFDLPNNATWSRIAIWLSLPKSLPSSQIFSGPWQNLAQRADLFGIAALIWAGAWGLGQLAMRLLRAPVQRGSAEHTVFAMGLGLSATSLTTLGFGLVGLLNRWLFVGLLSAAFAVEFLLRLRDARSLSPNGPTVGPQPKASTKSLDRDGFRTLAFPSRAGGNGPIPDRDVARLDVARD